MATEAEILAMNVAILATTAKNNAIGAPETRTGTNKVIKAEIASEKSAKESSKHISQIDIREVARLDEQARQALLNSKGK